MNRLALYFLRHGQTAAIVTFIFLARVGFFLAILWMFGIVRRPSERLQRLAQESEAQVKLPFQARVVELASTQANAFAVQGLKLVALTKPALTLLSDAEACSILRHELAHLTEHPLDQMARFIPFICYCFYLTLVPSYLGQGTEQLWFLAGLPFVILFCRLFAGRISRRLEERADAGARKGGIEAEAIYAAALEKIYAANLIPAVIGTKTATHPNLYDRMVKSGVTPAYPRPRPPARRLPALCAGGILAIVLFVEVTLVMTHIKSRAMPHGTMHAPVNGSVV